VSALLLTACASNSETPAGGGGPSGSATPSVSKETTLADLLPAKIKSSGTITVGTDPTYAPNEYKDPSGKIIGFDIDLFDAVAAKLGVKTKYVASIFDNIIPGITGGKYDIGVSSFTDNKKREQVVDFVTYFSAGMQWAAAAGKTVDPDNACGLKVSVQTGTTEADDLVTRSAACTKAGKPAIHIQKFDAQGDATTAVVLGKVEAMTADSTVTEAAVKQSGGKITLLPKIYDAAPYGYAIAKNAGTLKDAIQKAVQALIDDGTYKSVLDKWGFGTGAIKTSQINAAIS